MNDTSTVSSILALDADIDRQIADCLEITAPRSFFLYAGAGSGKTTSLLAALKTLRSRYSSAFRLRRQRIGVITYTNAACDEIISRQELDPLVEVSTIHSFAWLLINRFDRDIREWLRTSLVQSIAELGSKEEKGKKGTKTSIARQAEILTKKHRLERLDEIRKFTYSPSGEYRGRDSLSHSEVIKICAHFLVSKPIMQRMLVSQYPFLLIDESQDTHRDLVDGLLAVQAIHKDRFCLGLIGDTMQRIYNEGKVGIEDVLPADWAKPTKVVNHRCPARVVTLINKVRSTVDDRQQVPRPDRGEGFVRLFILPAATEDKPKAEEAIAKRMGEITDDDAWGDLSKRKTLILEHHMAARRMGFLEMFTPLAQIDDFRTGLNDGTLPAVRLFIAWVLPLAQALESGDHFAVAKILRDASPLLNAEVLRHAVNQRDQLAAAHVAVEALRVLLTNEQPTFGQILRCVAHTNLLPVPDILRPFCDLPDTKVQVVDSVEIDAESDKRQAALKAFLATPFLQAAPYASYISGTAPFDTHQGVKGREYPRVMIIMDDAEARGFMFSYEKLFGIKSDASQPKEADKESSVDRTRRLFYVTCSRAQKSLALIAYSTDGVAVQTNLVKAGWFDEHEIVLQNHG